VRRATLSLTLLVLIVAAASRAGADGFDARIGAYFPRGNETLFQDDRDLYLVDGAPLQKSDFYGVYGGIEYNRTLMNNVEIGIHLDGYGRTVDTSLQAWTRPDGSEIRQSLKFSQIPLGVTIRFLPTSKKHKIVPYVGGGVDAVFWNYEEYGDFVDVLSPDCGTDLGCPILADHFHSHGTAFGVHALGGLRVYLNRDFAIVAEGRYQWATDDMGEDFAPNEPGLINRIDLSGATFTVGVHVRF
jgi:Outer membrane protein beta-barrel domain